MANFLLNKHIKYFERNLVAFPTDFEAHDSSHTLLVFFCLLSLAILGKLPEDKSVWVNWVRSHLVQSGEGFRGSANHQVGDNVSQYDPANLNSTYFCLCILAILEDSTVVEALDKDKLKNYIKRCQMPDGAFSAYSTAADGPLGGTSVRHSYNALGILDLLGIEDRETCEKAARYVLRCQTYDGGFGDFPGSESHAGFTYCSVNALLCSGTVENTWRSRTLDCCVRRQLQTGGFNGRPGKPEDSCYSFWVTGTLAVLGTPEFVDATGARQFLIDNCQNELIGGICKTPDSLPDPLHSALGLCALSLLGQSGLQPVDPRWCVTKQGSDYVYTHWRGARKG